MLPRSVLLPSLGDRVTHCLLSGHRPFVRGPCPTSHFHYILHFTTGRGEGSRPNLGEISKGRVGPRSGPVCLVTPVPWEGRGAVSKQVVSGRLLPRRPAHPQRAFLPKREVRLSLPGRLSEGETLTNQTPNDLFLSTRQALCWPMRTEQLPPARGVGPVSATGDRGRCDERRPGRVSSQSEDLPCQCDALAGGAADRTDLSGGPGSSLAPAGCHAA